jgi:hypothetical protein
MAARGRSGSSGRQTQTTRRQEGSSTRARRSSELMDEQTILAVRGPRQHAVSQSVSQSVNQPVLTTRK